MTKEEMVQTVKDLIEAPSCYDGLRKKAEAYLAAEGEAKKAAADALVEELEGDVSSIDSTIAFFGSPTAEQLFGKEQAAAGKAHAESVKAAGGKYCDCPACAAGKKILDNREVL